MLASLVIGALALQLGGPRASLRGHGPYKRVSVHMAAADSAVAIITGGSGGIGLATAHKLAARGCDIVIAYGSDEGRAAAACAELESEHGVRAVAVKGDLTEPSAMEDTVSRVFAEVDSLGGEVSAFVHAAGYFHERLLEHHLNGNVPNFTVYDEYSTIYPKAFVAFTEGAVERMRDGNGRIVAITNPGAAPPLFPICQKLILSFRFLWRVQHAADSARRVRHAGAGEGHHGMARPRVCPPTRLAPSLCECGLAWVHGHQGMG